MRRADIHCLDAGIETTTSLALTQEKGNERVGHCLSREASTNNMNVLWLYAMLSLGAVKTVAFLFKSAAREIRAGLEAHGEKSPRCQLRPTAKGSVSGWGSWVKPSAKTLGFSRGHWSLCYCRGYGAFSIPYGWCLREPSASRRSEQSPPRVVTVSSHNSILHVDSRKR